MTKIQFRRGAAGTNPVLAVGEPGYSDAGQFKVGNGSTAWNSLPAFATAAANVIQVDAQAGADDDARFNAAITALGTTPGVLVLGAHSYTLTSTKTLAYPGQGIKGQGLGTTIIDYRGTGDCLRMWDSTVATDGSSSPGRAGPLVGFQIIGWSNANTNICGLHIGDLQNIFINNFEIAGFDNAGSKNFWGENRYSWSENYWIQMRSVIGTDCYRFETHASHPLSKTSWDYGTLCLSVSADPNQTAFKVTNDVDMEGVDLTLVGNCTPGVSNTGVAVQIGTSGSDTSYIAGKITVSLETTGGTGTGHKDINTPNSALAAVRGVGSLVFNDFSQPFVAGSASPTTVSFAGRVNSPSLGYLGGGEALRVLGYTRFHTDAAGVNYMTINDAATGVWPGLTAAGSDTDVGIFLTPQGAGSVRQWVNTQTQAVWSVNGTQTNIDNNITSKGTGKVKANGVEVVTLTGAQTETNKTFTDPKIGRVLDANGNVIIDTSPTASAVNYLRIDNAATGGYPSVTAAGTDTDIGIFLAPQGAGPVRQYVNTQTTATWSVNGTQTDIDQNITSKGAGRIKVNGAPVGAATTSAASASSLTPAVGSANLYAYTALAANLTINAPTGTPADGQPLDFRIKDNGTTRTLTWNAIFRIVGTTLPTATTANKTVYVRTRYNAADTKYDVIDVKQEA